MRRSSELIGLIVFACALWQFAFHAELWNFWARLSLAAVSLATSALIVTPDRTKLFQPRPRNIALGVISALVLYGIFWLGKQLAPLIVPCATAQISNVYANREQLDLVWIGLLLFFLVGPSEEIFWRGFVQRRLNERLSAIAALLVTTAIYALVHMWTLNLMLILAAAVAGLFWGWLYQHTQGLVSGIVSHALWDLLIFVAFPFM